jgi:hypothetical protein
VPIRDDLQTVGGSGASNRSTSSGFVEATGLGVKTKNSWV